MDFTRIKQLVVPEGVVKKIEIGGQSIWQSEPEEMNGPFTAAQSAAIRAGDFTDVPVGYAWTFEDVPYTYVDANNATQSSTYSGTMRVADCDYYLGTGDVECTTHHVVVVPDESMYVAKMKQYDTNITGYVGSQMRTVYLRRAEAIFKACFGESHVLKHREYLVKKVSNGKETEGAWYDSTVELMDERMVYSTITTGTNESLPSVSNRLLSLFKNNSNLVKIKAWWWLRNVSESQYFLVVSATSGTRQKAFASTSYGVRPYALIY